MPRNRKRKNLSANTLHHEMEYFKKHLDKLWEHAQDASERLQDIEVHVNLLTRLLTAICVERLGMRIGVLKRLVKRIEKEAIRDTQIHHLENLYKMTPSASKKSHPPKGESEHRWEDIS